ncbi:putative UPF0481 protein [Iris pallida]|uniref:UPF0481 protein n=1 Tax=Iris pallida TaxID=29817 RepID=A0AAX6DSL3_IRIPA|nr:putative UPF0481 protein [Iris pallida]
MVAVFNKELLSWYLITLKLKETVESGLPKSHPSSPSPAAAAADPPPPPPQLSPADAEWIVSIKEKLEQAQQEEASCPWARLSIYHVPKSLREGDEKVYVPQLVSLGPYHRGKRRLRHMEPHKWRALHQVLRRTGHRVELYLDSVRPLEEKARACYEGTIALTSNDFVETMVLDGTFVLELFRGAAGEGFKELGYCRNDPIFAMRGTMHSVQRDMIMLENQIPLFVLDRLLAVQVGQPDRYGLVARIALRFFDPLMPTDEPLRRSDRGSGRIEYPSSSSSSTHHATSAEFDPLSDDGLHCLEVFRRSLLRTGPEPAPRVWIRGWSHKRKVVVDKRRQQLIHCVSELRDAGFQLRRGKTDRFWDIKFQDGVLRIPRLLIHDGTKSLLLNLIAFEQCHVDCGNDITSYVVFMDNLINSDEDVAYLHYHGIIEHWLGNDGEVADLFNRLCQEVVFDINDSYLSGLSEQVNRYYNHKWNSWRASLVHNYFGNPWAIISLVAAVFLLVLTLLQTYYTIYAYYWPNS